MAQTFVHCPSCSAPVGEDKINIAADVAQCEACGHLFRVSEALAKTTFSNAHKMNLLMPAGITVTPGLQLDIALRWRKLSRVAFYGVFALAFTFMPGFMLFLMSSSVGEINGPPFFAFALLGLFLMIGLGFTYYVITLLLNTTHLTATSFELILSHRPIQFIGWKPQTFKRSELSQFFVTQYEEGKSNNRPIYAFALNLILQDGKEVTLIKGLRKAEVAFYLEHQLEQYLQMEDRPVAGEFIPGQTLRPQSLKEAITVAKALFDSRKNKV
ncbi:MAG: hypothetical protein R2795_21350 [Saprospiraceae bacterium]